MARPLDTPAPLSVRRVRLGDLERSSPQGLLGALAHAEQTHAAPTKPAAGALAFTGAGVLDGEPVADAWYSAAAGPLVRGQSGSVRWAHDGHWLHGALALAETEGETLAGLALRAYRDVFATLDRTGFAHLLMLWNYLPGINADGGGLERYRQFNSGRQQAFLEARRPVFEGAPAACALGARDGPLRLSFLAGRRAPLAIENPRQVPAYRYPSAYGPRSPTFSRAALVAAGGGNVALLISGTASIVGHASVHAGDVQAQTRETVANLEAVIGAARERSSARFELAQADCTVYVRHAWDAPQVRRVFEAAVGTGAAAARNAVYVQADICRSDLLVEIEAHVFAPK